MCNLNYGIIGNCRSAALISQNGNIEWACLPNFSSNSVFAKILDKNIGGEFSILVDDNYKSEQKYIKNTNILVTKFYNGNDAFEIIDFMPRYKKENNHYVYPPDIIRYIRHISGKPVAKFKFDPKLVYAKFKTVTEIKGEYIKSYTVQGDYESVYLYTDLNFLDICNSNEIAIEKEHYFLLSYNQKLIQLDIDKIILEYERTKVYWLEWTSRTVHFSCYSTEIIRSALVLKILSYQKTGALIAAITTSLPEAIGEVRNWDYRFCWIRDASMIISVLTNLGHYNVAERFIKFIIDVIPFKHEKIQIMYGINKEKILTETELTWLSGYKNSKPVRIGNKAYLQKQNDIYGVLLDAIHKYFELFKSNIENSEELWTIVRSLIRTVEKNWKKEDTSIWEYRSKKMHFVFSKVLCWVALDRGVKIAELLGKNEYITKWKILRMRIKNDVMKKGWNEEIQAFTQSYENKAMDSANLLMATYGFIEYSDEKYIKTVMKVREELAQDDLIYRYKNKDDFGMPKSSFTICSFWMIKSLYKIGKKIEAYKMFQNLLSYSNHLGLFSEDIDFKTKQLLGNFPQGYSHLALIDTAMVLSEMEIEEEDKIIKNIEHFTKN